MKKLIDADKLIETLESRTQTRQELKTEASEAGDKEQETACDAVISAYRAVIDDIRRMQEEKS